MTMAIQYVSSLALLDMTGKVVSDDVFYGGAKIQPPQTTSLGAPTTEAGHSCPP